MEYGLWAMFGWCGTKWPGWWRGPRPPQPDPWWWIVSIAGAVGGVIAVTVFKPMLGDAGYLGTALTALAGGVVIGSIVDAIGGAAGKAAG